MIRTAVFLLLAWGAAASASDRIQVVRGELRQLAESAERNRQFVVRGTEGWLFLTSDIRTAVVGPFWGEQAHQVSRARRKEHADPLECIVDVHRQLQERGIALLLVPVPSKVAVLPDRLTASARELEGAARVDADHADFLKVLASRGISTIDLLPALRGAPGSGPAAYCQTDSHWSGAGIDRASQAIVEAVGEAEWLKNVPRRQYTRVEREVRITGDLAHIERPGNPGQETVRLAFVVDRPGGQPPRTDPQSPVLLLGDSHVLVFHDAGLHAAGAGLPDQLAWRWGFGVDVVAVRGSGSTAARVTLARNKQRLEGKKLVVWCFAAREFTESSDGWRKVPL